MTEFETVLAEFKTVLADVIQKESLDAWLQTPNDAFDGLKPLDLIESGSPDCLWSMIYFLRSGNAY